jgi:hypothetical protein
MSGSNSINLPGGESVLGKLSFKHQHVEVDQKSGYYSVVKVNQEVTQFKVETIESLVVCNDDREGRQKSIERQQLIKMLKSTLWYL